ncbi:MAG: DUF2341 domain-containing protein, partial [Candidatus Bathyarchaeia archaeon]
SDYAIFWVKVNDDLSTSCRRIYIYYGKSDATTTSNGTNTFLLFDDFDDDSINANKWTVSAGCAESGGTLQVTGSGSWNTRGFYSVSSFDRSGSYGYGIRFRVKVSATGFDGEMGYGPGPINYQDGIYLYFEGTNNFFRVRDGSTLNLSTPYSANTFYTLDVNMRPSTGYRLLVDGIQAEYDSSFADNNHRVSVNIYENAQTAYFDYIFVRKYVDPEPSYGPWGEEEQVDSVSITVNTSGLGTGYYATITYYNASNQLTTRKVSGASGNSSWTGQVRNGTTLTISQIVDGPPNERWKTSGTVQWTITGSATYSVTYVHEMKLSLLLRAGDGTTDISAHIARVNATGPGGNVVFTSGNWTACWVQYGTWTITGIRFLDDAGGYSNVIPASQSKSEGGDWAIITRTYPLSVALQDPNGGATNAPILRVTYPSGSSKEYAVDSNGYKSLGFCPNGSYALEAKWNGLTVNSTNISLSQGTNLQLKCHLYSIPSWDIKMAVDGSVPLSNITFSDTALSFTATSTGTKTGKVYVGAKGKPYAFKIDGSSINEGSGWSYDASSKTVTFTVSFSSRKIELLWYATPPPSGGGGGASIILPTSPTLEQAYQEVLVPVVTVGGRPILGLMICLILALSAILLHRQGHTAAAYSLSALCAFFALNILFIAGVLPMEWLEGNRLFDLLPPQFDLGQLIVLRHLPELSLPQSWLPSQEQAFAIMVLGGILAAAFATLAAKMAWD